MVTALRNRDGPYHVGYRLAIDSLKSLAGGMLAGNVSEVVSAFQAVVVADDAQAVDVIVSVLAECVKGIEYLVNFVRLVRGLLQACPQAAVGVVEELVNNRGDLLIGMLDVLPRSAFRIAGECHVTRVRVTVVENEGGWGRLFIALQKGLLFGDELERNEVLKLGKEVVMEGSHDVVKEAVEVLDASVVEELTDISAVGMLGILGWAVMRGVVKGEFAERLWQKRVEKRCPNGLIRTRDDDGSHSSDGMQIDIGLICSQSPCAVSLVVPSAIALRLASNSASNEEFVARNLLDVLVLVPVVCIPLYNAVEDCNQDFEVLSTGTSRSRTGTSLKRTGEKEFPQVLQQTSVQDLATAVSSFGAGMSAIVGILNLSCVSLKLCERVMSVHGRSRNLGGDYKDVVWTLLERLTEFDRMLNALLLGHEMLQIKGSSEKGTDTPSKQNFSSAKRVSEAQRNALSKAESTREAVVRSVFILDDSSDKSKAANSNAGKNFPRFSVQSIVCLLTAVPDEAGVESLCNTTLCKQSRDIELARIDKMLLRQLFHILNPSKVVTNTNRKSRPQPSEMDVLWNSADFSDAWDFKKAGKELAALAQNTECLDFNFAHNVFSLPNDGLASDKEGEDSTDVSLDSTRWAWYGNETEAADAEYVRSTISLLAKLEDGASPRDSEVASAIHSPAFAALLLDRAATYVAVARRARQLSAEEHYLSTVTTVAGFALRCLIVILRFIPVNFTLHSGGQTSETGKTDNADEVIREFLDEVDEELLVGVPESQLTQIPNAPITHGVKTISTLLWMSHSSIDVTVATLGLDALLTISEFGCLRFDFSRRAVLSSLTTVYEYDGSTLWAQDDQKKVLGDPFSEWGLRRRQGRRGHKPDVSNAEDLACDQSPGVNFRPKGLRKTKGIEKHRLCLFFNGMHIPNALLEASAWVREISLATAASIAQATADQESMKSLLHGRTFRETTDKLPPRKRRNTSKCETLLDMIGFQNIVETILQLVHHALENYRVPDNFSVADALQIRTSPVMHIQAALKLFCSILRVYHRNRQAILSKYTAELNFQMDGELEYAVLNSSLLILLLTRARVDNIHAWYSNPATDLSQLSNEVIKCLEKVIGCAMSAVRLCTEIVDALKKQYSSLTAPYMSTNDQASLTPAKRKNPSFARGRRNRVGNGGDGVSRARRIVPRVSAQCEAVTRETQKLAKVMGLRAKKALIKYTPVLPDEEWELEFGIGLGLENKVDEDVDENEDNRERGAEEIDSEEDLIGDVETNADGSKFRAKARGIGSSAAEPETIKVKFKH